MLYFADYKWWCWHKARADYLAFKGEKATIFVTGNLVDDPEVAMVRKDDRRETVSDDPEYLCTGSNSGHQAINIAVLAGAKRLILLGYDAHTAPNGRKHFFGDHPDKTTAPYETQIRELNAVSKQLAARGIEVLNATPDSVLECFKKVPLDEALC